MGDVEKRLKELDSDKAFLARLEQAKNKEEVIEIFQKSGVDLTEKDIDDFINSVARTGELSEETLNDVSGGSLQYYKLKLLWYVYRKLKLFNRR